MKPFVFYLLLGVSLVANDIWDQKVYTFGNLTEVINSQGTGDTTFLINTKKYSSLYAVGLLDKLQGEIQIFNSKPYITSINENNTISMDSDVSKQATFLVYADVPQWISIKVPNTIYNKQQFVEYLEDTAKEYGISTFNPFPFLLEGKVKASTYRIITYKGSDKLQGYGGTCACDLNEDQQKSKLKELHSSLRKTILNTPVTILGFYSPQRGVITDQYSYTYMNFLSKNKTVAGHIQKLMIGESMTLKLPKL